MLESQGVITAVNGGSFIVADAASPLNSSLRLMFTLDDRSGIHHLFELRRILEVEAAALAAERHGTQHLEEMDAAVEEMDAALADSGGARLMDADLRFHLVVAEQPSRPTQHAGSARRRSARADDGLRDSAQPRERRRRASRDQSCDSVRRSRTREAGDEGSSRSRRGGRREGSVQWLSSASSASE